MTLHVASVYFDYEKQACGFLLGADSLGRNITRNRMNAQLRGVNQEAKLDDIVIAEKSFRSPNTIGFCSGSFQWPKEDYDNLFRSFDNCFEEIGKRKDYSEHVTLMRAYDATLSIVKRSQEKLELYGVYKRRTKTGKAIAVRRYMVLTHESFQESKRTPYWTRLNVAKNPSIANVPGKQPLVNMHNILCINMLLEARRQPSQVSAPFDFYAIDFDEIRKVA